MNKLQNYLTAYQIIGNENLLSLLNSARSLWSASVGVSKLSEAGACLNIT